MSANPSNHWAPVSDNYNGARKQEIINSYITKTEEKMKFQKQTRFGGFVSRKRNQNTTTNWPLLW